MIPIVAKTKRTLLVNLIDLFEAHYPTTYRSWLHDPEVTRFNSHGLFPYTQKAMEQYVRSLKESQDIIVWAVLIPTERFTGTVTSYGGVATHIGNITLQRIHTIYHSAEMAIVIGEKEYWEKGFATEALTALYDHGFNRLNLHRIWSGTAITNKGMQSVFAKLGMKYEGTFAHAMFLNGEWTDVVEWAILEEEWKKRNGKG